MLNPSASINWIGQEKFKEYKTHIPVYLSTWENHVRSWMNMQFNCPYLFISYEDLVYKKEEIIKKLINFFERNYKIEIAKKDMKIDNILNSTSFDNLQKLENKQGFNESVNNRFFAVGQKNQWKNALDQNQIGVIEHKFGSIMKKLKYKLKN